MMLQLLAQETGLEALTGFSALVGGAVFALGLLIFFAILAKSLLKICAPNEVLIVSGIFRGGTIQGRRRGYDTVIGGRTLALPGLQRVDRMSLTLMEVPITVRNAYSRGGIAMNVEAVANVKISSDPEVIGNAVERFMNRDLMEVRRVAKETLEGHLRGVIANLTPEQVNEDRLSFAESLTKETEADLRKLGLHLDTLKITHVTDEVGYLDATGRKAIANIIREAEIAESDAKRVAEKAEAENAGRANVAVANVDAAVAQMTNELRRFKAELEAEVRSQEERTLAAARQARAEAEQELQQVRAELEALRLQVEKVLPAEADRRAQELKARGQAAIIRERGRAVSEALELLYQAWQQAGPAAMQIQLTEDIEKLIRAAAEGVQKLDVGEIRVIDGGDGRTLPNYMAQYPAMLEKVFEAVQRATGIDVPGTVSGQTPEGGFRP